MVGVGQVLVPVKIVSERLYRSARVYVIVGLVAKLQGTLIPKVGAKNVMRAKSLMRLASPQHYLTMVLPLQKYVLEYN